MQARFKVCCVGWCGGNTPDHAHKGQGSYLISVGLPVRARCPCRGSLGFLNVTALDTAARTGLSNPRKGGQETSIETV